MAGDFPEGRIKRGRASLIGGIATGVCVLAIWLAGAASLGLGGVGAMVSGAAIAVAIAAWVRMADL
ncbi:MAG: hypothetical protein KGI51_02650 [Rhodospirillales bacterium]|nr:hypothetical protein [Rhodospirillales bacterium]